jgi:hypothetical protein
LARRNPQQLATEEPWVAQVTLVQALVQEIETVGVGEGLPGSGALANAPHAEQEKALRGRLQETEIGFSSTHAVIFTGNMTPWQQGPCCSGGELISGGPRRLAVQWVQWVKLADPRRTINLR